MLGGLGWVVEWGHETKNNPVGPRSSRRNKKKEGEEKERFFCSVTTARIYSRDRPKFFRQWVPVGGQWVLIWGRWLWAVGWGWSGGVGCGRV